MIQFYSILSKYGSLPTDWSMYGYCQQDLGQERGVGMSHTPIPSARCHGPFLKGFCLDHVIHDRQNKTLYIKTFNQNLHQNPIKTKKKCSNPFKLTTKISQVYEI